jgi:D-glycero-D-manno-heptose 1,7-bisphosphate phosphatase
MLSRFPFCTLFARDERLYARPHDEGVQHVIEQAVILAGGMGTRLGDLTLETPKPILPIAGKPFLVMLVDEIRRHGIRHILILAGFQGAQIAAAFSKDSDIDVVVEPEPAGTGGALRFARQRLQGKFLFLNGDSWFDINLLDLALAAPSVPATLAVRLVDDASRYGAVILEEERVVSFAERSSATSAGFINGGVAILSTDVVDRIPAEGPVSIERDVYPELARKGLLAGRRYDRPFIDIGVPDDFARAQTFIPAILDRPAVIFDRDGVLNEDVGYAHLPEHIHWMPGAIEAVKWANDAGFYTFVATNQAGVARGMYTERHIHQLHAWMNRELARVGAHIDAFAYSPFHPDGVIPAYSRRSECRKPGPQMLLDLMAMHGVEARRAVMIGDRPSDLAAAEAAGVRGVMHDGRDLLATVVSAAQSLPQNATKLQ